MKLLVTQLNLSLKFETNLILYNKCQNFLICKNQTRTLCVLHSLMSTCMLSDNKCRNFTEMDDTLDEFF